jgi:hypothetical protein
MHACARPRHLALELELPVTLALLRRLDDSTIRRREPEIVTSLFVPVTL